MAPVTPFTFPKKRKKKKEATTLEVKSSTRWRLVGIRVIIITPPWKVIVKV